jgi:hypothetical protein
MGYCSDVHANPDAYEAEDQDHHHHLAISAMN